MTISDSDFAALRADVDKILEFMGDMDIRHGADVAGNYHDKKELPNGDYPLAQNIHQLRQDVNMKNEELAANIRPRLTALENKPAGNVTPAQVIAALATYGANIAKDPETGRLYFALGMKPDFDNWIAFQVGGGLAAGIAGYGDSTQLPGQGQGSKDSVSSVHVMGGEGNMGFVQYGKWGKKGFIRNTLGRPFTTYIIDSTGEICGNQTQAGKTEQSPENGGGQIWYLKYDFVKKLFRILTFRPGWAISIERCSTQYANADKKVEPV